MADAEMDDALGADDSKEIMEQKIINEEYKIWKKNTPFLYDLLYARALKWPTLTAQWFPDVRAVAGTEYKEHRLLVGTNTSGDTAEKEQNYLQIWKVEIPHVEVPDSSDYNDSSGEFGGHGTSREKFKCDVLQEICHPGEVNKARYMPQNPDIIATWAVDNRVLVWDRTKHPLKPKDDVLRPDAQFIGHEAEGFGMSWSPHKEGELATASEDRTVRLWDLTQCDKENGTARPFQTWTHHTGIVNDVQYHPMHTSWIATASDDLSFAIIDTRMSSHKAAEYKTHAHSDAVNCVAIHPRWHQILATGSADKTVALWDLRNLDRKLHSIEGHKEAVIQLQWHPQEPAILTSGSYDRRIIMYDLSRTGEEQTEEEAEEGPPEMLFMHGGFTGRVTEFDWNPNDPWLMLAAAEDNQMQIFRPARALVNVAPKKNVSMREVEE
ncbi:WD40 repeat-like protein [Tothia fuscella]|uniref:WD40 repeat-like protein n=1 Tax=Tothia fuscella TaxID=1048955 RepID=A0A9P4NGP2_9PEZI|nr:WD40 repeat-like protein [Tothia fuscella]